MKDIIRNLMLKDSILARRFAMLKNKSYLYDNVVNKDVILDYQLIRFNQVWGYSILNIPFYKMWQDKYNLPSSVNSLEEVRSFPILTKFDIQKYQDIVFNGLDEYHTISTGGSTGQPVKFPLSSYDNDVNYANNYMLKKWWGIQPFDKIVLFWGHSHLFGSGFKGIKNEYKRKFYDWLINTTRLNAYDMTPQTIKKYYGKIKIKNPALIIGYTSIIFQLAKYMNENNLSLKNNKILKGVIVTSETVTEYDVELIEKVFKVPCIIEYGMAETGVIAYSKGVANNIKLLWDSFYCFKGEDDILIVTTLTKKLFPLINYSTDDEIYSEDVKSILSMNYIMGRKKDLLEVQGVNIVLKLSGILMIHIMKAYPYILEIQCFQRKNYKVEINFTSLKKIDIRKVKSYFIDNIKKDHPEIISESFEFINVPKMEKTIAGKLILVDNRTNNGTLC